MSTNFSITYDSYDVIDDDNVRNLRKRYKEVPLLSPQLSRSEQLQISNFKFQKEEYEYEAVMFTSPLPSPQLSRSEQLRRSMRGSKIGTSLLNFKKTSGAISKAKRFLEL